MNSYSKYGNNATVNLIAKRLSARQLILHYMRLMFMYVNNIIMYVTIDHQGHGAAGADVTSQFMYIKRTRIYVLVLYHGKARHSSMGCCL